MRKLLHVVILGICQVIYSSAIAATGPAEITPNDFSGSDSQRIKKALDAAKGTTNLVRIPRHNANGTALWKIDEAILLPGNMTVMLDNCTIQLSDSCRDNMFRSANVGIGIENPRTISNIHLIGVGRVLLKGAENPRSTGDGARQLSLDPEADRKKGSWRVSYGSDAAFPDRKQTGDWRNIMILVAEVDGFSMTNVRIENSHAWAVSFERARNVELEQIYLHNPEEITIGNRKVKVFNKDGIDLRQGCKNFRINNIHGFTGDDFIALSSLDVKPALTRKSGSLNSTMVTKSGWHGPEDDTEQIFISNITCESICRGIAIRASDSASIHHVYISGIVSRETTGVGGRHNALLIGGKGYGALSQPGKLNHIYAQNIVSTGHAAVMIEAPVADCHFMNILYSGKGPEVIHYAMDKKEMRNVTETALQKVAP
ncbi:hypothetical protein GCM10023091_16080 [Ravibacter arvi]|uniref:Glycosyl hydrolase family 28 n=1 Tax=Ravibacter arvi TaxID=2051041 RepID=A0ABP8LWE1_9BACT